MKINHIYQGDCLEILKTFPSECIDMVITSPPYWGLRDYGVVDQIGREENLELYFKKLCDIFAEVKRVLKAEGSCWVNLGDAYGGICDKQNYRDPKYKNGRNGQSISLSKKYTGKCLLQIPSRFALMMTDELGYILRNEIIWHKPNAMPESVKDRFTTDYEKLFFFVKNKKYYFKQQKEPMITDYPSTDFMRNKRSVWSISTRNYSGLHFAVYPEELIETPIKAGCPKDGIVLDPFMGSGTTGVVAKKLGRNWIGIEINPEYVSMAQKRIENTHYQFYLDFS